MAVDSIPTTYGKKVPCKHQKHYGNSADLWALSWAKKLFVWFFFFWFYLEDNSPDKFLWIFPKCPELNFCLSGIWRQTHSAFTYIPSEIPEGCCQSLGIGWNSLLSLWAQTQFFSEWKWNWAQLGWKRYLLRKKKLYAGCSPTSVKKIKEEKPLPLDRESDLHWI